MSLLSNVSVGRGHYMNGGGAECGKAFLEILLRTANRLFLQENISTDPSLRKQLAEHLEGLDIFSFFEDENLRERFLAMKEHSGNIIWRGEGNEHYFPMDPCYRSLVAPR